MPALTATQRVTGTSIQPICGEGWCVKPGHFWLHVPIQDLPYGQVDPTYRYGSSQDGQREMHTGVEFQAPAGDTVLAVGDGIVEAVYTSDQPPQSTLGSGYGNLVILAHHLPGIIAPVYSLYAHLAEVRVSAGQVVAAGQQIGTVGETGIATGPHLHFEVRFGNISLTSTRNPELWLLPLSGQAGAIAGRIQTAAGQPLPLQQLVIQPVPASTGLPGDPTIYLETYARADCPADDTWQENFAAGSLPPGEYRVAFTYAGNLYTRQAPVQAGQVTVFNFTLAEPS